MNFGLKDYYCSCEKREDRGFLFSHALTLLLTQKELSDEYNVSDFIDDFYREDFVKHLFATFIDVRNRVNFREPVYQSLICPLSIKTKRGRKSRRKTIMEHKKALAAQRMKRKSIY